MKRKPGKVVEVKLGQTLVGDMTLISRSEGRSFEEQIRFILNRLLPSSFH